MEQINVKIKRLDDKAILPTQAHEGDAGWDLYALGDYTISPNETVKIHTGISMQLPPYTFGAIYARSGLSSKQGLRPANCTGICDAGYTGEYIVALHNDSDDIQHIPDGTRIAQLIIQPFVPVAFEEVDSLEATERGSGGFGSSGV